MNKQKADYIISAITDILTEHELVSVSTRPDGWPPDIRINQVFEKAYRVDYDDGQCSIGLCDSYGVMTGAKDWIIDPDKRAIHAKTTNAYGDMLFFSWVIADGKEGEMWDKMHKWQKGLLQYPFCQTKD